MLRLPIVRVNRRTAESSACDPSCCCFSPARNGSPLSAEFSWCPNRRDQQESSRRQYHRFRRYAEVLEEIRAYLREQPLEKADLQRLCYRQRVPADFDVAQITWHPDYDLAYYGQLARWRCSRSRKSGRELSVQTF
jgi:hypothetical protein